MRFAALADGALTIPRLALGGNIFGYACDERGTAALLAAALELGVNFVDTADIYSAGRSETFIGRAIRGRRERWLIATKAGLASHADPSGLAAPAALRRKLEGSLVRLGTDYVDLYQIHHYDPVTPIEEAIAALDDLRREGKIRLYGVSNFSPDGLAAWLAAARRGERAGPATVQCHYNLFSRGAEAELMPLCRARGVAVLAYGVLARGVLAGRYRRDLAPPADSRAAVSASIRRDLTPEVLDTVAEIEAYSRASGLSPVGVAVAWALRRPEVGAVVVGVRSPAQLGEAAAAVHLDLSDAQTARIEAVAGGLVRRGGAQFGSPAIHG